MKAATFFLIVVPVLGAAAYIKVKKPELFDSLKARLIPGGNGSFQISDFYQPIDKGLLNKVAARLRRKELSSEGWENEKTRYSELEKALAAKVDELNRLSTYEAQSGAGPAMKDQAFSIAKQMNELEKEFTVDALQGRDEDKEE